MTSSCSFLSSVDEHINGKAFRELSDEQLKELGFKMGARINIKGIISSTSPVSETGPHDGQY